MSYPVTLYILKCNDDSFYVGITKDLYKRLDEHNMKLNGKYFLRKSLHPFRLVWTQDYNDNILAKRKEQYYKKLNRKRLIRELKLG